MAVWEGVTPGELLAAGVVRAGVPVHPGQRHLLPLPKGGFYTSWGEIPPETDVAVVQELTFRSSEVC